ncbi:MAG: outer membrane beta-barrel protein [Deltaproteobacteria bacterium]|nr:outer membrane beta-barrel protein [Deltaproteobacteria bacterium]
MDLTRKFSLVAIFVFLFIFVSPAPKAGFGGAKFVIKPKLTAASRFDSNFYLTDGNERDVYSFLVQPGIQLGLETPKTKTYLDYDFEANYYHDNGSVPSGENRASSHDYFGHLVNFSTKYEPTSRLMIGFNDTFYRTLYPYHYDRLSDNIEKSQYDINRMTPSLLYDLSERFTIQTRYRRTDLDYEESNNSNNIDSTEHRGYFNFVYYPTRTTSFDLEYQHWLMAYEDGNSDYVSDQVKLNFQKRFKYYTFDAGVGYHYRDFDNSQYEDGDAFAYKVAFTAQNPPPPEIKRPPGQSFIRSKSHFYIAAERNFSNYDTYAAADRFTASMGHVFFRKILTRVKGYYQISDYDDIGLGTDREDKTYQVSGTIGYLINNYLSLNFTAGIEERDSNMTGSDYENNFFILSLDFNYDISGRGGHTKEALYY